MAPPPSRPSSRWLWLAFAGIVVLLIAPATGTEQPWVRAAFWVATASALVLAAWAAYRLRVERAEHQRRTTQWAAQQAVTRERLAIARDLHDIVSHTLGAVTVRAGVGRRLGAADPAEMIAALRDIEDAARAGTTELRRMLEVLRTDAEAVGPPLAPVPDLARLPDLVATAERSGLVVRLSCDIDVTQIDEGVQLAAYRVVQEGLTNAARYAGPAAVDVQVRREGPNLRVRVADQGPGHGWRPRVGAGHGLLGLTERVSALGGNLRARAQSPGFLLEAELPTQASS